MFEPIASFSLSGVGHHSSMFMNIVATATATFPKSLTREELRGGPTASILLLLPLLLLLLLLLFFFFFFFFLLFHSPFLLDAILCRDSFISPLPTSSLLNLLARILFRILFRIRIRQSLRSFEFVNFYRLFWVFFQFEEGRGRGGVLWIHEGSSVAGVAGFSGFLQNPRQFSLVSQNAGILWRFPQDSSESVEAVNDFLWISGSRSGWSWSHPIVLGDLTELKRGELRAFLQITPSSAVIRNIPQRNRL